MRSLQHHLGLLAVVLAMTAIVGCQQTTRTTAPKKTTKKETPKQDAPRPAAYSNANIAYFPTGIANSSLLKVERSAPAEVSVGSEFDYQIIVTNISDTLAANDVVITETVDGGLEVISATPNANKSGNNYTWSLGNMLPGQSETINVKAKATSTGDIIRCVNADFTPVVCLTTRVVKPALELVKDGPGTILLCDGFKYTLTVSNTGSGPATNVVIEDTLPDGLVTATTNSRDVKVNVGTLKAGESKKYEVSVKATKTGSYKNTASASADGGLKASDGHDVTIVQPVLTIAADAPERRYLGRVACHEYTIKNTSDTDAANASVSIRMSGGEFLNATGDAQPSGDTVTISLGTLKAGDTRVVKVCHRANKSGKITSSATVNATCADAVSAKGETSVEGIPALLLEVIDIDDPDELGTTETYVVTVTNQGSANATNVKIEAMLEDSMGYVSTEGPTKGKAPGSEAGGTIVFEPLPSLAPKAKATWKVIVKSLKTGDVRFGVKMQADQLDRPVQETESTNFYE